MRFLGITCRAPVHLRGFQRRGSNRCAPRWRRRTGGRRKGDRGRERIGAAGCAGCDLPAVCGPLWCHRQLVGITALGSRQGICLRGKIPCLHGESDRIGRHVPHIDAIGIRSLRRAVAQNISGKVRYRGSVGIGRRRIETQPDRLRGGGGWRTSTVA